VNFRDLFSKFKSLEYKVPPIPIYKSEDRHLELSITPEISSKWQRLKGIFLKLVWRF